MSALHRVSAGHQRFAHPHPSVPAVPNPIEHRGTHRATEAHEKSLDTTLVRTIVATDAMARICQGS